MLGTLLFSTKDSIKTSKETYTSANVMTIYSLHVINIGRLLHILFNRKIRKWFLWTSTQKAYNFKIKFQVYCDFAMSNLVLGFRLLKIFVPSPPLSPERIRPSATT